ncbi:MAG: prepilin peptidase [Sandarakinorhabdus sp.]|nr:prepilin peptidase [Sandarakinorhabdus sp.]
MSVWGAVLGSFIAAATLRWAGGRSIIAGRSACESCQRQLSPVELVPLLSYVALGGACRSCRAPIGRRQPAIEIAAAVIGGVSIGVSPDIIGVLGAVFGWVLLMLLVLDFEHLWLPDRLTAPLAAGGLLAGWLTDQDLAARLLGLVLGYASLWLVAAVYRARTGRDGIGGGDPKLLAAVGAWLGAPALPLVVVTAGLAGVVLVAIDAARGAPVERHAKVAFGALLALVAWPLWIFTTGW